MGDRAIVGCGTPGTGDFKYCGECDFEYDPVGCETVRKDFGLDIVYEQDTIKRRRSK